MVEVVGICVEGSQHRSRDAWKKRDLQNSSVTLAFTYETGSSGVPGLV